MSDRLKTFLEDLSFDQQLPSYEYLLTLADGATCTLETEVTDYRPLNVFNDVGGLLDFTSPELEKLPLIIVPDMHARAYFLRNILNYTLPEDFVSDEGKGLTVFEALSEEKLRIVFVGDLLHSELRCRDRWMKALLDFNQEIYDGEAMTEEMKEGLTLLSMIMELKIAFPKNVHVLKGNHENILNVRSPGNFPFRKFANEGEMVKQFMSSVYGDDVLMVISCFEKKLPLAAVFPNCIISHAEPAKAFSKEEIINGLDMDEVVRGLTWTENNAAQEGCVQEMLDSLTENPESLYFGGHRPIQGTCAFRQDGKYVQLHNPDMQYITLIRKDKPFNPDTDIVKVGE